MKMLEKRIPLPSLDNGYMIDVRLKDMKGQSHRGQGLNMVEVRIRDEAIYKEMWSSGRL